MLSKNNRQLTNRMNAKQRQRFGLRKLTVGVASVLLGTTFFLGGVANADTTGTTKDSPAVFPTQEVSTNTQTATNNNGSKTNKQSEQVDNQRSVSRNANEQSAVVAPAAQRTAAPNDETVSNLTFTGSVSDFKNTTTGKAATDTSFKTGDTAELTYTMRGAGDTGKLQDQYWPVTSHYLAMLPSGFQLANGNNSWKTSFPASDYQIEALGKVGPNGEYVYRITLSKTPYYGIPVDFTAQLVATDDSVAAGGHDYNGFPIPGLLMALNDNGLFVGQHAITLGNQTYQVSNCSEFLHGNNLGSEIKYTIVPGTNQLATSNYQVTNLTSTKKNVTGIGNAGYEEITPTIKLTGDVHAGDYIDFHLGIPYTDSQTGKLTYKLYDSHLAANFTVANIGTVYNMGNYYRLVFNNAVESLNHPTFDLNLRWGSSSNQASLKDDGAIYVYRLTDDPNKDRTAFTYQPTNDVTINGQTMASGLSVKGNYVYIAQPIATGNQHIGSSATPSVNRTWNQQGDVSVDTHWSSTNTTALSTADSGNEFDLKVTITKDPHGLVNYTFTSADEMKRAIENNIATTDTHKLTDGVQNDSGTFVTVATTKGQKPAVNVNVTMTKTVDSSNPNKITAVWHIKLANADPASAAKIMLTGAVPTVTASADNFTIPTGITSYQQDINNEVHTANYNGAKTGNEALMNVLKDLPVALTQVVSYKNGQPDVSSGVFGGPWSSIISYNGDSKVDGGGSASDLITATVTIKDQAGHTLTPNGFSYQGPTGTAIKFAGLQSAYNGLSGYHFVKAVSVKNGVETPINLDLTKLDSDSFGTANKNNPTQFIIYLQQDQTEQTANLDFVDDTDTTNDLSSHNLSDSGNEGTAISFANLEQTLKGLTDQHYILVNVTNGAGENISGNNPQNIDWSTIFGKYGSSAASFTIHFKHATHTISDAKTVNEIVHYVATDNSPVPEDHMAKVDFTRDGYNDEVTGDDHWNAWKPAASHEFAAVPTPTKAGYTPDKQTIAAQTVTPTSQDLKFTVTYTPAAQTLTVKFIDDTDNGKVLKTVTKTGVTDADAGYRTTQDIQQFLDEHYVLVSDSTNGQSLKFDNNDSVDQQYEVHLKHATHTISDAKTVKEIVHYVATDNSTVPVDHTAKVDFTRDGYNDEVTGDDHWNAWKPAASHEFVAVPTPTKAGYTPDKQTIAAQTVTPTSQDLKFTVTYTPAAQTLTVKFIDDTDNGKVLKTVTKTGVTDADAGYRTTQDIQQFLDEHYVLVSDSTNGQSLKFDNNDSVDQQYEVHLKHATQSASDAKTVTETIHYVYANNSKAADDYTTRVDFKRTGTTDLVTNKISWNQWTPAATHQFAAVSSPKLTGYTASDSSIAATTVSPTSDSIVKTVTYTPDAQHLTVKFIDDTDNGKLLKAVTKTGVTNGDSGYSTTQDIQHFLDEHYKLVSDDTNGQSLKFDNDDQADQQYEVHFKHVTHAISDAKTITETIHYVATDNSTVPDDHTAKVDFTRDGYNDEVTGDDHWNAWKPDASYQFKAVPTPPKAGYTADQQLVAAQTVTPTTQDLKFTVTYTPDAQHLTVKFIDDTDNGKVLKTVTKTGVTNGDSGYSTKQDIHHFLDEHYELVSDNTNGQQLKFDNDDQADQQYEVHFKHATQPASETKTVTETIHYVYADGAPAAKDYTTSVDFQRTGTTDLVTNQTAWGAWTPVNAKLDSVPSPQISGYTANELAVAAMTVTPQSDNVEKTITYTANPAPVEPTTPEQTGRQTTVDGHGQDQLVTASTQDTRQPAATQRQNQQKLPQTGNHNPASLITLGVAGFLSLFGLGKDLRKRH